MKKILIALMMLMPLMSYAQSNKQLTPQQQLEQAQKRLEEAQKAVAEAKANAERAQKAAAEAKAKAEARAKALREAKAKELAEKQAAIQKQIKEAQEEAARLNAEAARLNAEAEQMKSSAAKTQTQKEVLPKAEKRVTPVKEVTKANPKSDDGWEAPVKKEVNREAPKYVKTKASEAKEISGYLAGAVPEVDGKVVFTLDEQVPGKTADEIYAIAYDYMSELTQDDNQKKDEKPGSMIALVNKQEHTIAARMTEWLVFTSNFINLDRTEFNYTLITTCADEHINMQLCRINYVYEEHRDTGMREPAEKLITDENALNKDKTGLRRMIGKFRTKTIDRKNEIFSGLKAALNQ